MKRIFLLLTSVLLVLIASCSKVEKEKGTLYTKDDIFIDCIKINYPEAFTSKVIVIEDNESLAYALNQFPKLESMPRFDEIMENYSTEEYTYVVEFISTSHESETITCDGIIIDKENMRLEFKIKMDKKRNDTFETMAGYITYAVIPKEEIKDCDFRNQPFVLYPGK